MAPKRKIERATSPVRPPSAKKPRRTEAVNSSDEEVDARPEEQYGIVQRDFYPPQMSNERCKQYNDNEIPRPMEVLNRLLQSTQNRRAKIGVGEAVVHWFKRDLRTHDNRALSMASEKAKSGGVPLICMFIVSPQDYQAHLTSPARVDFELRTLEVLKEDLAEKEIPLYIATVGDRKQVIPHIMERLAEWGAKQVYCNIEYEVDELRREAKLVSKCLEMGISFTAVHDDVVVAPETLMSGAGKQYSVYSPWLKAWIRYIHEHPQALEASEPPAQNPAEARSKFKNLFAIPVPTAPSNKALPQEDRDRLAHLWPAGEHEAQSRLTRFLKEKASAYRDARNLPATNGTATLSAHFAAGTLSARTAVRGARDANSARRLDAGNAGLTCWISEIAWRDFYKHVLAHWPYVCMHKPFKYEYTDIRWEYDAALFARWCEGRTGYPIVDAAMRQLNGMAWMHNRCRMIVASFLAKDLLIDWRMGERYFMERLIDGDFASNNGGWGFSASTGVDPQPYFRIFNPLLQSEKFDAGGEYIRKWVPELKGVGGKAIHDPYGRGAGKQAEKAGYPRPVVEHKACRERALERYKEGLGRGTANVGGGVHN
ncbi:DNA photolyase phr1 [Teratosphaeriaceae sp. CCFEE 6253]|nr:DNA photolyase phr1 [Teratosphaeriaceae sp. CCFEE 6253]